MASILSNKTVIPVGSFGGAGVKILKFLEKKLEPVLYNIFQLTIRKNHKIFFANSFPF